MSASFAPECTNAKKAYDNCFNEWYSEKFLKAKSVTNECEETWKVYEACIYVSYLHSTVATQARYKWIQANIG